MKKNHQLPILIEKDEDGFYVVECPVFFVDSTRHPAISPSQKGYQDGTEVNFLVILSRRIHLYTEIVYLQLNIVIVN